MAEVAEVAEHRILIHATLRRDAELVACALDQAGFSSCVCKTLPELMHELAQGAGALLTVEEALAPAAVPLAEFVSRQPTWSDFPIVVMTTPRSDSPWIRGAYDRLGNCTLLERPVHVTTLVSTVRGALRARLRQYQIRLADQRKDEFLAMLAHELRNPLAPIGAAAQLLEIISPDEEKVKKTCAIISRQVVHMSSLIDDLLDIARVTRKLINLSKEPADFRKILSEAVEQVSPLIRERHHHLVLHLPPSPVCVLGDHKRLVQIVVNLLNNAAKYTPNGGDISMRLAAPPGEVVVEVADNGIGMAAELVPRVFDLFSQAERSSDRSQGGLGLGLPLVKNLVELHGGSVSAESGGPGKGSRFTVRLPQLACALGAPGATGAGAHRASPAQPLRVLVVDDNADAANTLDMLLDASGHEVVTEYNAAKAIERAQVIAPQVCLLDIGLPDMDGCELARRLRSMPGMAQAILIAVTGYGQEQDKQKTRDAGFDFHFVKPINTEKLLTLLAQVRVA
jgi:signal transduction histidine kinase